MLKIVYRKQVHLYDGEQTYEKLSQFINQNFSHLPEEVQIGYTDAEGDRITVSSDSDLQIFKQIQEQEKTQLPYKLQIFSLESGSDSSSQERKKVFKGLKCLKGLQMFKEMSKDLLSEEQIEQIKTIRESVKEKKTEMRKKFKEEKQKKFAENKAKFFNKVENDKHLSEVMINFQEKIKEVLPQLQDFLNKDFTFKGEQKEGENDMQEEKSPQQEQQQQEEEEQVKEDKKPKKHCRRHESKEFEFPVLKMLGLRKVFKYAARNGLCRASHHHRGFGPGPKPHHGFGPKPHHGFGPGPHHGPQGFLPPFFGKMFNMSPKREGSSSQSPSKSKSPERPRKCGGKRQGKFLKKINKLCKHMKQFENSSSSSNSCSPNKNDEEDFEKITTHHEQHQQQEADKEVSGPKSHSRKGKHGHGPHHHHHPHHHHNHPFGGPGNHGPRGPHHFGPIMRGGYNSPFPPQFQEMINQFQQFRVQQPEKTQGQEKQQEQKKE